jgi:hypothetical protein
MLQGRFPIVPVLESAYSMGLSKKLASRQFPIKHVQEAVMKTQNIHIGSFVIGLLAGGAILLMLALSQPLRTETQTSQQLRNDTRQFQVTTTRSFDKNWAQFRTGFTRDWQKTVRSISQSFNKDIARIGSSLHSSNLQPCVWSAWLDRQLSHLAALMNIHSGLLNPPACSV